MNSINARSDRRRAYPERLIRPTRRAAVRGLGVERLEDRLLLATFVVNTTKDLPDRDFLLDPPGPDGVCLIDVTGPDGNFTGECSLRAAIQEANATPGPDTIQFNIDPDIAGPVPTIRPRSQLPTIVRPVVIDGTTQPGFRLIELDGSQVGGQNGVNVPSGLDITAGDSTISGLVINRFPGNGIQLREGGGNTVRGNLIGTDPTGSRRVDDVGRPFGNGLATSAGIGIAVTSPNNTIGGAAKAPMLDNCTGQCNVISGNLNAGVALIGATASGNVVLGNFIGTDQAGLSRLGNGFSGILINNAISNTIGGAGGTTPGGICSGACNVISGNGTEGIEINQAQGAENVVVGNFIGTDVTGTRAVGNKLGGIEIVNSSENRIGGVTANSRNIISANDGDAGIQIFGETATSNIIEGNFIGTDTTGRVALRNETAGILINGGASSNTIGTSLVSNNRLACENTCNLISGNHAGVVIAGAVGFGPPFANQIFTNNIGTDVSGTRPLPNSGPGILIRGGAGNEIGDVAGRSNVIAFNDGTGIEIESGTGNKITMNSIFRNAGLGIDLGEDNTITRNDDRDPDDGPNRLQNFPIISSIELVAGSTVIHGNLNSSPGQRYRVEFFGDTEPDATGSLEGRTFLCAVGSVLTDGDGNAPIDQTCAGEFPFVTATATDVESGDTSEFSAVQLIVNSSGDAGDVNDGADAVCDTGDRVASGEAECTLRAAIQTANFNRNKDLIQFDLPAPVLPIVPEVGLPQITQPVIIDGFSQSGSGTLDAPTHKIIIDGTFFTGIADPKVGIDLATSDSVVRGLLIGRFDIGIRIDSGSRNVIEGNDIFENRDNGVVVIDSAGSGTAATANRISQNTFAGNGGLAIDLNGDGATLNDASGHAGPNLFQNFPELERAVGGSKVTVKGVIPSLPGRGLTLEFFASDSCDAFAFPNGAEFGEAARFVGTDFITTTGPLTPFHSQFEFEAEPGMFITATATDAAGSTSELSDCVPVTLPLIFLPGIAGSHLATTSGNKVWLEPFVLDSRIENELSLAPNAVNNVIATDVTRRLLNLLTDATIIYEILLATLRSEAAYDEYETNNEPALRTAAGCDLSQLGELPTLFVLPYDWRFDIDTNADRVKDYVGCIQRLYPDTKIDLLAHSMGGLVGRRYLLENPGDHDVNKMVTLGSPWLGAAKAINSLFTGNFFDIAPLDQSASARLQRLAEFWPGAHNLLPSRLYHELAPFAPFSEDSLNDLNGNGQIDDQYSYEQFVSEVDSPFLSNPATAAQLIHDFPGQDDWQLDTTGVDFLHLVGRQAVDTTAERVIATRTVIVDPRLVVAPLLLRGIEIPSLRISPGPGDGTVPLHSATKRNATGSIDLNARRSCVEVFDGSTGRSDDLLSHNGITRNPDVLTRAIRFLDPNQPIDCPGQSRSARGAVSRPAYYLEVAGVRSLTIRDDAGRVVSTDDPIAVDGTVPGATVLPLGGSSFMAILATDRNFTLIFETALDGFNLEVTRQQSGVASAAVRYLDQIVPRGGTGRIRLTPDQIERIQFDATNDETFEQTLVPTVELAGTAAQDTEPPTLNSTVTRQGANSVLTITAQDSASGVRSVFVSLDGGNSLQPVTGPIVLDPTTTPIVFGYAEDNAANRTGLFEIDVRLADLTVREIGAPPSVPAGSSFSYRFEITNRGPADARDATFVDELPPEIVVTSIETRHGSCGGGQIITCQLGVLASGESSTVEIAVEAPLAPALLRNRAEVHSRQVDPNRSDNAVETQTQVVTSDIESLAVADPSLMVATGAASLAAFSDNGFVLAFDSTTAELDLNFADTNGASDVFVANLLTGELELVSVNRSGAAAGNGASTSPSISGNGRFVAFASNANDLVAGLADRNGVADDGNGLTFDRDVSDVFVRDLVTGSTQLVSVNRDGTTSLRGASFAPTISRDGRFVAFYSEATDLIAGISDMNGGADLFVRDLATGTTRLVTKSAVAASATGNERLFTPDTVISGNSRFLAFSSSASDLVTGVTDTNDFPDIFVYDLLDGTIRVVSVTPAGTTTGNHISVEPSISDDGSLVAFESHSNNLVDDVSDESAPFTFPTSDIFVRDLTRGTSRLVTISRDGRSSGSGFSHDVTISGDGRTLAFVSFATNIAGGVSGGNNSSQLFTHDLTTGQTTLASALATGGTSNFADIFDPILSGDGRIVAFTTAANRLVADDDVPFSNEEHAYVRDVPRSETIRVDDTASGGEPFDQATPLAISRNGRFVAFTSQSDQLVPGGVDGAALFVRDLSSGETIPVVSRAIEDAPDFPDDTARDCRNCAFASNTTTVSANGRFVVFDSDAPDLAPGDANGTTDVFRRDLATGTIELVSANRTGLLAGNGGSSARADAVSADGRFVVFTSDATDLVAGDTNGMSDVFVRDIELGTTTLVSVNAAVSGAANGASSEAVISPDGRRVAFISAATNLVVGISDTIGRADVFVRDLVTGVTTLVSRRSGAAAAGNGESGGPRFIASGAKIAFESRATDLVAGVTDSNSQLDVFVHDLAVGTNMIASVNDAGTIAAGIDRPCCQLNQTVASADAEIVVFMSGATGLVPGVADTNGRVDLFVRDLAAGTTRLVSATAGGGAAGNAGVLTIDPATSADGRTVAFWSESTNLVGGPATAGCQLFVRDLVDRTNALVTRNASGGISGNACLGVAPPLVSADGRAVAFASGAFDLVPGVIDNDNLVDVFLRDVTRGVTSLVSHDAAGNSFETPSFADNVTAQLLALTGDGATVIFRSGDGFRAGDPQLTPDGPGLAAFRAEANPAERFQFSVAAFVVNEDGGPNAVVTITRQFPQAGPASVRLTTRDGSATAGSDFTDVSQVINFAPNEFVRNVLVPITDDTEVEGDEFVILVLSAPSAQAIVGVQPSAELRILDNDLAGRVAAAANRAIASDAIDRYRYTVAQNGVLTVQLHTSGTIFSGANSVLEIFNAFGNRRVRSSGPLDKQADIGGVRAGETFTIVISDVTNSPYDLKIVNVLNRVLAAGDAPDFAVRDRLEFTASGAREFVSFGVPFGSDIGSGRVEDILIVHPELPDGISRTRYDVAGLGFRLGTAPYFGLRIRNLRGGDGVLVDPTITVPITLASGITDDAATTPSGSLVSINVLANDGDTTERLRIVSVSRPQNGSATDNRDGTITYVSAAGFVGADEFRYEVADDSGNRESATVRVTVTAGPPANTDTTQPTSTMNQLPPQLGTPVFDVSWVGVDNAGGSGIASFDIFVSDNSGPFIAIATATQNRSLTFTGEFGHTYGFFSVATDVAGNRQPTPAAAQATTTLVAPPNGPHVTGLRLLGNRRFVTSLVLAFDRDLNRTTATQLANYELRSPGGDTAFNTADDAILALRSAKYNTRTRSVTLRPAARLNINQAFQLTARDAIADTAGNRLDGNNDSLAGGDHVVRGGRWTTINYTDQNGDLVTISLELRRPLRNAGLNSAGLMEVVWGPDIAGRRIILSDTTPGESVLVGSVEPGSGGDGQTTIESIAGQAAVRNRLPATFVVGTIASAVVDRLLDSGEFLGLRAVIE